jgi:hypothetical protein
VRLVWLRRSRRGVLVDPAKPLINHLRAAFPDARYAGSPPDVEPGRSGPHRFRIIEDDLKAIYARLAGLPTYKQPVKMALLIAFVGMVLGIVGIEAFGRDFPARGSICGNQKFREPCRSPVFDNACRLRVSVFFTGALSRPRVCY